MTITVRPDLTVFPSPATDGHMTKQEREAAELELKTEHDQVEQMPEGPAKQDAYEGYLLSSLHYEQTLAVANLEPTNDGQGVQPLGTRTMLSEVAEDTGRIWEPTDIHEGQLTWVEEYRTEGARVVLDEGEWYLCQDWDAGPLREPLAEHDDEREMLIEASLELDLSQKLSQQLEEQNRDHDQGHSR